MTRYPQVYGHDMSTIFISVFSCLLTAMPMFRHFLTAHQALYEGVEYNQRRQKSILQKTFKV
jgi:hypothetical protein